MFNIVMLIKTTFLKTYSSMIRNEILKCCLGYLGVLPKPSPAFCLASFTFDRLVNPNYHSKW